MSETKRPVCGGIEEHIGKTRPVLDDGFIRVVDYMGGDESIVQAARVSYGKGTRAVRKDVKLIDYLMRHRHTTPFEMCEIKFHVRVPMDCWRQWIRHRTANVNEYSTRYSEAVDAAQTTSPDQWRLQSESNRQGSGSGESGTGLTSARRQELSEREASLLKHARYEYSQRLAWGVAREQARKDLPLSTYTEAYWKIDLHNLFHFLHLRLDPHAQYEIRQYAIAIAEITASWVPFAWDAFERYRELAMALSFTESLLISCINLGNERKALAEAEQRGWLDRGSDGEVRAKGAREHKEFSEKLHKLAIACPWPWLRTDVKLQEEEK